MTNKTFPTAVALFCASLLAAAHLLAAPSTVRSYVWYGELVGINRDARLAILKAEFREHVLRYIDQFKPGDRVTLTWATSREGETDDIIYVGQYDKSSTSNYGYVLPVEVVAVNKTDRTITFKASSVESVGELWLGELPKSVIQGEFSHSEGSKTVGSSHGHFGLIVETLDHATGDHLLGLEIVENEGPVRAQHLGDLLHRLDAGAHSLPAPVVHELPGPGRRGVVPELLEVFFEQVRADGREVVT